MRGAPDEITPGAVVITGKEIITGEGYNYPSGYVMKQTIVDIVFDENNRPSLSYTPGPYYYFSMSSVCRVYYVGDGEVGGTNILPTASFGEVSVEVSGQDIDITTIMYSWFDNNGDLNSITRRDHGIDIAESSTITYQEGITVCACTVWKATETTRTYTLPQLYLEKNGVSLDDVEYTSVETQYVDGWYTETGWNGYYGISWSEGERYIGGESAVFVSSTPGVFWLVREKGPDTGWYEEVNDFINPTVITTSDPPAALEYGVWKEVFKEGFWDLYIDGESSCDVSNCFVDVNHIRRDYERIAAAKNILSTGKGFIETLVDGTSESLANLEQDIQDNLPSVVPDISLFATAAYNINGYLYADMPLAGLCLECIESGFGSWIGGA
jgi:hypothetical protein